MALRIARAITNLPHFAPHQLPQALEPENSSTEVCVVTYICHAGK